MKEGSRQLQRRARLQGFVYFIQVQGEAGDYTGCVKIGFTGSRTRLRLDMLQVGSVLELKELLSVPAPVEFEGLVHGEFRSSAVKSILRPGKLRKEWFHPSIRLKAFISFLTNKKRLDETVFAEWKRLFPADAPVPEIKTVEVKRLDGRFPNGIRFPRNNTDDIARVIDFLATVKAVTYKIIMKNVFNGEETEINRGSAKLALWKAKFKASFKQPKAGMESLCAYGDDPWEKILTETDFTLWPTTQSDILEKLLKAKSNLAHLKRMNAVIELVFEKNKFREWVYERVSPNRVKLQPDES
jgi:hypothetical protein